MELDDETESVTPLQKLEALAERVEFEQGEHPNDMGEKLRKMLMRVKRIIAHGELGVNESFNEFMSRGHGGSPVDGINPMGIECTTERFLGEAGSWIKTIWNSHDEEEAAEGAPLGLWHRGIAGQHARAHVEREIVDVIRERHEPRGAIHAPHPGDVQRLDVRKDGSQEGLPRLAGQDRHRAKRAEFRIPLSEFLKVLLLFSLIFLSSRSLRLSLATTTADYNDGVCGFIDRPLTTGVAFAKSARAKFARVRGKCVQICFFRFFSKKKQLFCRFLRVFRVLEDFWPVLIRFLR